MRKLSTCIVVFQSGILELETSKEAICVEEGLSMEYVSWNGIWRMSIAEGGDSCLE